MTQYGLTRENCFIFDFLEQTYSTVGVCGTVDLAILKYMSSCGLTHRVRDDFNVFFREIFTSERKRVSFIFRTTESPTGFRMCMRGASEILLETCSKFLNLKNGEVLEMDEYSREKCLKAIEKMAETTLCTVSLVYKDIEVSYEESEFQEIMNLPSSRDSSDILHIERSGFVFFGVIGIQDTLRKGISEAVQRCNNGAVRVIMVTGDHEKAAETLGKKISLLNEGYKDHEAIIDGTDFLERIGGVICKNCGEKCSCFKSEDERQRAKKWRSSSKHKSTEGGKPKKEKRKRKVRVETVKNLAEFRKIAEWAKVLTRSGPQVKHAMIVGLKELGNVVAVTGHDADDALALKKADVGFAMGDSGTEVAKQSADILITDGNFSSIVNSILWGRNIYGSIRKFLMFQFTVNVSAMFILIVGAAKDERGVISAIQLLWINMIMDSLASLALATEPPDPKLIEEKPYKRSDSIFTCVLLLIHSFE